MEINREKRLLARMAEKLADINSEDLTKVELDLAEFLAEELYLVKEEKFYDDGEDSLGSYFVYRVVK